MKPLTLQLIKVFNEEFTFFESEFGEWMSQNCNLANGWMDNHIGYAA